MTFFFFDWAFNTILAGADAESALSAVQRQVDAYALCLETTTAYESEQELTEACMTQVLQTEP